MGQEITPEVLKKRTLWTCPDCNLITGGDHSFDDCVARLKAENERLREALAEALDWSTNEEGTAIIKQALAPRMEQV